MLLKQGWMIGKIITNQTAKEMLEQLGGLSKKRYDGRYLGSAIFSFFEAIPDKSTREEIVKFLGVDQIDPERWYDINDVRLIYYYLNNQFGKYTIKQVGRSIIEHAIFPPEIYNNEDCFGALKFAYELYAQGINLGSIKHEILSEKTAILTFSTPFPCYLDQGIILGCGDKFGKAVTIEHSDNGCRDQHAESCTYICTW